MISVIIPLYNKRSSIERTLRSIFEQNFEDMEVIIVDDGSTDGSWEFCQRELPLIIREGLARRSEGGSQFNVNNPVVILSQTNGGPSKARNTGVKNAKGDWIVFLDADDELLPGALRRFADAIEEHKDADFIACPFYNDNGKERTLHFPYKEGYVKNPFKSDFLGRFLPRMGAFACKKELLEQNPFNEEIRRFEDLEMLYRVYHTAKIYTISEPSMVVNQEFAEASHGRKDISEDFLGHLDFKGKSFWEKMCLYKVFLGERPHYPEQCRKLYPWLYKRFDLYFMYQLLTRTKKLWI